MNEIQTTELTLKEQIAQAKAAAKLAREQAKAAVAEAKEKARAAKEEAKAIREAAKEQSRLANAIGKEARETRKAERAIEKARREASMVNGVAAPAEGSMAAAAWTVFDRVSRETGYVASISQSLDVGRQAGLSDANIRSQYARWRKYHGVTGRVPNLSQAQPYKAAA